MPRSINDCAVALALCVAAGCAGIPQHEFTGYRDAFQGVAMLSEQIIADHEQSLAIQNPHRPDVPNALSFPASFDLEAARTRAGDNPRAGAFRNALAAISAYNDLLQQLAEGRAASELDQKAHALVSALQSVSGSLAIDKAILDEIVSLLAAARTRAQFSAAMRKGKPVVDAMIDNLIASTPSFYKVRAGCAGKLIADLDMATEDVRDEMERIAAVYAMPDPASAMSVERARIEATLSDIWERKPRPDPASPYVPEPLPVGVAPFDETAMRRLNNQLELIRQLVARRDVVSASMNEYHNLLRQYVALLDTTKRRLANVQSAIDASKGNIQPDDLVALAATVNDDSFKLLDKIRAVRGVVLPQSTQPAN